MFFYGLRATVGCTWHSLRWVYKYFVILFCVYLIATVLEERNDDDTDSIYIFSDSCPSDVCNSLTKLPLSQNHTIENEALNSATAILVMLVSDLL